MPQAKMFQTDNQDRNQNGLISSIDFNNNDEVKMDGVVLFNKTSDGSATQTYMDKFRFCYRQSIFKRQYSN